MSLFRAGKGRSEKAPCRYIPSNLIGESWLADNIFEIIEAIDGLDDDKKEAFEVWLSHGSHDITTQDITDLIRSFENDFQGGV